MLSQKLRKAANFLFFIILQFHGIGMDDHDDAGKPPYPILSQLTKDEFEYVSCWQDHYIAAANGKCVGFLKEFLDQQKSGKSYWKLPQV